MNDINDLDIAIIGLNGRFPQAKDINSFWHNLKNGVESISFFSEEELLESGISSDLIKNPNYVKAGAILSDVEMFDASFFGFSSKEAELIDPQQRLFLESAWEVIESAGYDPEKYSGSIGVYAGTSSNTYLLSNIYPKLDAEDLAGAYQLMLSSEKDFLPTRVSYKLNLKGPAVNVQTACSTSLVAVHIACQSLLNGECDMALAGGVSISIPQKAGYLYSEGMIASPDGHCRAFDAKAEGTLAGSGLGIVLLKRLEDAIADKDYIHAVIKGSAINNDGSVKVGYTAPSTEGQAAVIAQAQAVAEVDTQSITYIEAHGTGTKLGDPIEIAALTKAFRQSTEKKQFCAIGSLKTNIGHLDAAAGVGGLLKTVLALKHKLIPPSLHFEGSSPNIDFANSPFYVNTALSEWNSNGNPRRAGVSSFGIGGTNAHVILEEAPSPTPSGYSREQHLLVISAKSSSALEQATVNLGKHLKENPQTNLADVAYTLSCGRRAFEHRRMLVCQSTESAAIALGDVDSQNILTNSVGATDKPVVFMFPGQGSQYVNMALELYETESLFREQVDLCAEILKPELELDLRQILYPQAEKTQIAEQELQQTAIAQVAIFVVEYALAKLWQSWGVSPQAMIGHSIGEYVAATLAGVFSLEAALRLVAARGKMMQQLPNGTMLSVPISAEEVEPLLTAEISIAAINESSRCVVSGSTEAIEILESKLASQSIEFRRLHTSHAFHSQMMESILDKFKQRVEQESLKAPQIPYISNLTGDWITEAQATDANYWVQHLRQTVLFAQGIEKILSNPEQVLLEVGPGRTLSSLTKRHPAHNQEQLVLTSLRHPKEEKSDVTCLLTTVGNLWLAGVNVDWLAFYSQEERYRVPLPTYPFERQRYWISPPKPGEKVNNKNQETSKQSDISKWFYIPSWKRLPLPPSQLEESLGNILLFIDEHGLGEQLATQLIQMGKKVICVKVGDSFRKESQGIYSLNPQIPDDYNTLLNELDTIEYFPNTIVHLWSVTLNNYSELTPERLEQCQDLGIHSLIFTAQALGRHNLTNPLQMVVVSNNLQEVNGDEVLSPEKATLLGPVEIIPLEYPNISCRSVDVIISDNEVNNNQQIINQLLGELTIKSSDNVIAYRGIYRWGQTFEKIQLDASTKNTTSRLKEKGVYLITGGFGGMGLTIAEYLAQTVKAKIILLGRSSFPPREEWENWLKNHEQDDSISCKIRKVQLIEELGAEVLVISANVADYQQLKTSLVEAQKLFGHLNGVFHTAGVADYEGFIQKRTKEMTESILAAKVKGSLAIAKVLHGVKLDLFILFSSLASVLSQSQFGQVSYVAANKFLDVFSYAQTKIMPNTFTVSINWDAWAEVGMAVEAIERSKKIKSYSLNSEFNNGILPSEGIKVIDCILGSSSSSLQQVIVSTQDFTCLRSQTLESFLDKNDIVKPKNKYLRPNLGTTYIAPKNQQEKTLVDIFESILGCTQIGINDDFFELGGDSLTATMLTAKINQAFTVNINISDMFNLTTVAQISEYITNQQQSSQNDFKRIGEILELVDSMAD